MLAIDVETINKQAATKGSENIKAATVALKKNNQPPWLRK